MWRQKRSQRATPNRRYPSKLVGMESYRELSTFLSINKGVITKAKQGMEMRILWICWTHLAMPTVSVSGDDRSKQISSDTVDAAQTCGNSASFGVFVRELVDAEAWKTCDPAADRLPSYQASTSRTHTLTPWAQKALT